MILKQNKRSQKALNQNVILVPSEQIRVDLRGGDNVDMTFRSLKDRMAMKSNMKPDLLATEPHDPFGKIVENFQGFHPYENEENIFTKL
eukprot:snap_masked-scaffold_8-processed-gene-8.36-mRNA-1 protein AED:1.00 eAED:1.00 QI:0/-1/0/0/-1/1/1/0/88